MPLVPVIAGMVQVPAGGAAITDPGVAYIRSDGNDTTGNGSPSAPYLTAQKAAVTEGFTRLNIGVVNAGNITWADATTRSLVVSGMGSGSIIGTISTEGGEVSVIDVGVQSVFISSITTGGPIEGVDGGQVVVRNCKCTSIVTTPAASGTGATPAGAGGAISLYGECWIESLQADGAENTDSGDGGAGGSISIRGPGVVNTSVSLVGGSGGTPGADGTLIILQGGSIPTPTPDAATVQGAVINGVWFDNTYP